MDLRKPGPPGTFLNVAEFLFSQMSDVQGGLAAFVSCFRARFLQAKVILSQFLFAIR